MKWMVFINCYWLVGCCALAWQQPVGRLDIKRLYVEPFAVKLGTEKLREDLIAQLRKLGTISLVSEASNADATLSGEGEIWIKGYRSLNPRSGRLPSDGTPVYAGYLSVELKDPKGETLWSYLATPGSSEDISKDLAKRISKHLVEALDPGKDGSLTPRH
jgi:hypothetical protein